MNDEVKNALNEVVKTTIEETKRGALDLAGERTPRRHDINAKACRCIQPCGCPKYDPRPPFDYHTTTPYGQINAMFDFSVMNDRQFWTKFCESNNYPLGYLAGMRAMQMVKEIEDLRKELQLVREAVEKLKVRERLFKFLVENGATANQLKLVFEQH